MKSVRENPCSVKLHAARETKQKMASLGGASSLQQTFQREQRVPQSDAPRATAAELAEEGEAAAAATGAARAAERTALLASLDALLQQSLAASCAAEVAAAAAAAPCAAEAPLKADVAAVDARCQHFVCGAAAAARARPRQRQQQSR